MIRPRLASVELLATDVDGVLTSGQLFVGKDGEGFKVFHVHDGQGINLLLRAGIHVAIISAKSSEGLERRARDLGVQYLMDGRGDKAAALAEICEKTGVPADRAAMVGDDILDLPAMRTAGIAIAVANAHARVKAEADWVTERAGGTGALREIADAILGARGQLDHEIERLLAEPR